MNFTIEELANLSSKKAKIYTIRIGNNENTLFEDFLEKNIDNFPSEISNILDRLKVIGERGAFDSFFKLNEGKVGDGLAALYEVPTKKFRLYLIKYSESYIILGSGGVKNVRTWQEDEILNAENKKLQFISKRITERMKEGELTWSDKDFSLIGNFSFFDDE